MTMLAAVTATALSPLRPLADQDVPHSIVARSAASSVSKPVMARMCCARLRSCSRGDPAPATGAGSRGRWLRAAPGADRGAEVVRRMRTWWPRLDQHADPAAVVGRVRDRECQAGNADRQ